MVISTDDPALSWSSQFGLALAPLFEAGEEGDPHQHHVLLDGGNGTFALSIAEDELWRSPEAAAWAWSSDIAHHVTLTESKVAVVRWDRPLDSRVFSRASVDRNLEAFYSFLSDDKLRSNKTVVDHLLGFFRKLRSLVYQAGLPDIRTTDIFLASLAQLIAQEEASENPETWGLAPDVWQLLRQLSATGLAGAETEIQHATGSLRSLRLYPHLAVRHAGGQLFQEAHFELLRAPAEDLFGYIGAPQLRRPERGGSHFTPPAIARVLVEQAFAHLGDVRRLPRLTVCDPACGSGAFLHETLRAIRRLGFQGQLILIGQDVSSSAVAMARFVLKTALRHWHPDGGVDLRLKAGDSLGELGIPQADVIVMNPPFVSWGAQTPLQREQLRAAMGGVRTARGDLSMAFVVRALQALRPDGVMASLFPGSLLTLQAAKQWRSKLAEMGEIKLLASLGDYGLFTQALVQVGFSIIHKGAEHQNGQDFTALVTGNDPLATGEALRWLRKSGTTPPPVPITEREWKLFALPVEALKSRPTWRFPSPSTQGALQRLSDAGFPTLYDLFETKRGVQTGLNEALLLTESEWRKLPRSEREYFRLATMSDSIQGGRITRPYYVFFPHSPEGPLIEDEETLMDAVPYYYSSYILPHRAKLMRRTDIVNAKRKDWWGLTRARPWSFSSNPRLISKYFSGEGGFASDVAGRYLPVMGFGWFAKRPLRVQGDFGISIEDILFAYVALFNSLPFVTLLSVYCPHVAGGQFDLSSRYVGAVPVPNLRELSIEQERGKIVLDLVNLGTSINMDSKRWRIENNQIVSALYGRSIIADLQ